MTTKQKICFIVNPISGIGRQKIIEKLIDQLLGAQLSDQLKPLFANLGQAIPNKFDAQFGAEQDKFNGIFEK